VNLRKLIKDGKLQNVDDGGIILSRELVRQIGASVGDSIEIYSLVMFAAVQAMK
jgi:ABC-type lipoprotein release transport system permease subunit